MEIRQSLESNFLTCRMCTQPYQQPKVLECLHSFCLACLDEYVRKQREGDEKEKSSSYSSGYYTSRSSSKWSRNYYSSYGNNDYSSYGTKTYSITCILCDKKTLVPKGGCVSLPDDILSGKLASLVGKLPTYPICDVCTPDGLLPGSDVSVISDISNHLKRPVGEGASSCSDVESDTDSTYSQNGEKELKPDVNQSHHLKKPRRQRDKLKMNVNDLTSNHSYSYDIEMLENANLEPKRANSACLDCGKRLCGVCEQTHSSMLVTSDHILIRVDQLEVMKCDRHPRELRRFYCVTCEMCICIVCTFDVTDPRLAEHGHTDHNVLSIRQAVEAYQQSIDKDTSEVQIYVEKIERLLEGMHICEKHVNHLNQEIDTKAEQMISEIRFQQKVLKDKIMKKLNLTSSSLTERCDTMTNAMDNWYQLTKDDAFSERLDLMNPVEALDAALPLIQKVKECLIEVEKEAEPKEDNMVEFYSQFECAPKSTVIDSHNGQPQFDNNCNSSPSMLRKTSLKKRHVTFKLDYEDPPSIDHWANELGTFETGGGIMLGRIVTPHELQLEKIAELSKFQEKIVYVNNTAEQKHRCVQVNYFEANQADVNTQTETPSLQIATKVDNGTQYLSSDVNSPVSFFRGGNKIVIQK